MIDDKYRPWINKTFYNDLPIFTLNIHRLKQCMTCNHNPETCRCDESEEDENGMCKKWERKEE